VTGPEGHTSDWRRLVVATESNPSILAAAPFVELEGMVQSGRDLRPVLVHGIDPEYEERLSGNIVNLLEGDLSLLQPDSRGIILGRVLAFDLGVRIGDGVVLLIPRPVGDGTMEPVLERFIMRGVFEAGLQDHDSILALVNARDAASIVGLGDEVSAVRFRAHDVMQAPAIAAQLKTDISGVVTSDWTIENASYFRAIRLEKMMMSLILSLIIGVWSPTRRTTLRF
jgi:lipoprotein-releasing system permease protein